MRGSVAMALTSAQICTRCGRTRALASLLSRGITLMAADAMAPELSAVAESYPWRWKNRTRTANTAMSPPTSEVNMFEVSRARPGPP